MTHTTPNEFVPATQSELTRFVADNAAKSPRTPLLPVGGRTALNYGYPADGDGVLISTLRLNKTVDYPARDMTITVEAGIRIDELAATLDGEGQRLPVDVAQSQRATLGGVVATNTSGPRRFACGTMRDYVIGISAVDAMGRRFSAGGRVVKNVAGYDLCKLLVGSLGTLAIITQLTLKLRPQPQSSAHLWMTFRSFDAIDSVLQHLTTSAARLVSCEVLDSRAAHEVASEARVALPAASPVLCVGVEGAVREVEWQIETLKKECTPFEPLDLTPVGAVEARNLWIALTEFQTSTDEPLTFKANLLPSRTMEFLRLAVDRGVSVQAHAGNGIVIGHLPDDVATAEQAAEILTPLRQFCNACRGNVVIFHCDPSWKQHLPLFGTPEPSWSLVRALKSQLDPHGLLNAGRFIDGPAAETSRV